MIYEWATKLFTQPFSLKNRIIHERNKWLDLWVSHIIIHLTDSFKNTDSFWNETSGSLNVWVTESFTHPVCSKTMTPSGTKQVNSFISESQNINSADSFKNTDLFREKNNWLSSRVSHRIVNSTDSFKTLVHLGNETSDWLNLEKRTSVLSYYFIIVRYGINIVVHKSEFKFFFKIKSLNYSVKQFIQDHWLIQESLNQLPIYSKQ